MTLFAGTQYEIKCHPTSWVLCIKFRSLETLLQIFCTPATSIHGLNCASLDLITTTLTQSTSAPPPPPPPHPCRHQPGQLVYDLTLAPDVDLPNDSQTSIHSNNDPRHDSSPNNKHLQSVSHHKPHPSTRTTFLHYLYFPE